LANTPICDGLLPWDRFFLPNGAQLSQQLSRFEQSGFSHASLTIASGQDTSEDVLNKLAFTAKQLNGRGVIIAHNEAEILKAFQEEKFSISFHFQTSVPFANSLDLVDAFFLVGVQRAILAYNDVNVFADGCHEPRNSGLSSLGKQLIQKMDKVGMRVDLSHCGQKTTFDVLETGLSSPALFSHSNARALYDHERNLSDDQLRAARDAGSYVGINGVGMFLNASADEIPKQMARHAAYIAEFIGPDKVGLGIDFMFLENSNYAFFQNNRDTWPRGYPEPPWSFFQPEQLSDLIRELLSVGFSKNNVKGILGENYLKLTLPRNAD